ncbi:MAG: MBL fold metallo-hydrolase [Clostridia bacterium]
MKMTVLGNNGPFPADEGACSSYLFSFMGQNLLCDLGAGSLQNLVRVIRPEKLDVIVITHFHFDHFSDLLVLRYYLNHLRSKNLLHKKICLYVPEDPLMGLVMDDTVFDTHVIEEDRILEMESWSVAFSETNHPVRCYGLSLSGKSRQIVLTSDTVYTEKMVKFCHRADLLVADCCLLNGQQGYHLTAGDCGKLAREAGARALLLSHLNPMNDTETALAQAREHHRNTMPAEILQTY